MLNFLSSVAHEQLKGGYSCSLSCGNTLRRPPWREGRSTGWDRRSIASSSLPRRDAGTSLGCALYGLSEVAGLDCEYRWERDYLGPETSIERTLRCVDEVRVDKPLALPT